MRKYVACIGLTGTILGGLLLLGNLKEPYNYSNRKILTTQGLGATFVDDIDGDGNVDVIAHSTPFSVEFYDPAKKGKISRMKITMSSSARPLSQEALRTASDYLMGKVSKEDLEFQLNKLDTNQ